MELKEVVSEEPKSIANHSNNISSDTLKTERAQSDEKMNAFWDILDRIGKFAHVHRAKFRLLFLWILLLGYLVYFVFALLHHVGDEGSWRLIGCTILGVLLLSWQVLKSRGYTRGLTSSMTKILNLYSSGRLSSVIRWFLYVAMSLFMVLYVIFAVAMKTTENLRSLMGIFILTFMLFLYSNNKRKVNWHTVFWGMFLQFILALIILKTSWGASIIQWVADRLTEFINNSEAGSVFIFGPKWVDHPFAFGTMVQVVVLIVAISVLTYLGVIKFVVETVGIALAFFLQTSPSEGINVVANIFLNVPESALFIQEYLPGMTPSQLFVTISGALSTVGGVALVVFMASGIPAAPIIAASTMSAPAALAAAKLVFPSHDQEEVPHPPENNAGRGQLGIMRKPKSLVDSIVVGINQSVALVVQAIIYIMTFVIILEFINNTLTWFGDRIGVEKLTVQFISSYVFYPFAFLMGARHEDCLFIGEILGVRTFSLPVVAYPQLGKIILNGQAFRAYIAENPNNTWTQIGSDVILDNVIKTLVGGVIDNGQAFRAYVAESPNNTWTQVGPDVILDNVNKTLIGGVIDARSEVIATYALCGSASVAVIGLIIGSYEVMVPHRVHEVTQHVFRATIVSTVASYLTASFAGLLFEEGVGYE